MSSIIAQRASIESNDAQSTADDEGRVLSPDDWGPFRPLRAHKAIRARVKGNAQHVALILADLTPTSGIVKITHRRLASETGRGFATVPEALAECIAAGLLTGRRVMGGFVYTWCKVAYFPTPADEVGRRAENTRSTRR